MSSIDQKLIEDAQERKGFLDETLPRPDSTEGLRPFAIDEGLSVALRNPLSLVQRGDGWLLQKGWLDGIEITGSGAVYRNVAGGTLWVQAIIDYEYANNPGNSGPPQQYSNYKTGIYFIREVAVAFFEAGTQPGGDDIKQPDAETAGSGLYRETTYREIHSFTASGEPSNPIGPGWLSMSINLRF